jgi:hypothetical protein
VTRVLARGGGLRSSDGCTASWSFTWLTCIKLQHGNTSLDCASRSTHTKTRFKHVVKRDGFVCDVLVDAVKMCSEADPASDACAINGLRRVGVRKGVAPACPHTSLAHLEACGTVVATDTHKLTDVLDPKIRHPRRPCEVQSTCGVSARGKRWTSTPTPRSTSAHVLIDKSPLTHKSHSHRLVHTHSHSGAIYKQQPCGITCTTITRREVIVQTYV